MNKPEPSKDNYIYAYYQGIKNGTFLVNRFIRIIYEYLIQGLEERRFFYDAVKANDAIDWIRNTASTLRGRLHRPISVWNFGKRHF